MLANQHKISLRKNMVLSTHINQGMIIEVSSKLFRVESSVKVAPAKGTSFIKVKLRDLQTDKLVEKNFKPNQSVNEVTLSERDLEYLYPEESGHLFLDIKNLETVFIPGKTVSSKVDYLKEGVQVKAAMYGDVVFSIELPQFLELMVAETLSEDENINLNSQKVILLETGAKIEVPPFIDMGDIIKVDTLKHEYIQRV